MTQDLKERECWKHFSRQEKVSLLSALSLLLILQAFEDAELARLKEEKPGLTRTQYKDMIWKNWKKSPDNPLNQPASANAA